MAEQYLLDKLNSVEQTFHELTRRLADPDVAKDPAEFQKIAKLRSSLEETVNTYELWQKAQEDLVGAQEVYRESASDPELKEMAALEVAELEEAIQDWEAADEKAQQEKRPAVDELLKKLDERRSGYERLDRVLEESGETHKLK